MTRRIVVRPLAAVDLREIQDWYDAERPGLGDEFRNAADALLRRLAENPQAFPRVHGEVRRAVLRRFPYLMYFLAEPGRIVLLACLHARRRPALHRARMRPKP